MIARTCEIMISSLNKLNYAFSFSPCSEGTGVPLVATAIEIHSNQVQEFIIH